jgi:hypothetical protein
VNFPQGSPCTSRRREAASGAGGRGDGVGYSPRRKLARERLRVAQRQGQLREDADLEIIVDQLRGACYHRLLVLKVPFDESIVERLVDHALYGAAPRGA